MFSASSTFMGEGGWGLHERLCDGWSVFAYCIVSRRPPAIVPKEHCLFLQISLSYKFPCCVGGNALTGTEIAADPYKLHNEL